MTNILEKIIEEKKQSLILTKKEKSFDVLEKNIKVQNNSLLLLLKEMA